MAASKARDRTIDVRTSREAHRERGPKVRACGSTVDNAVARRLAGAYAHHFADRRMWWTLAGCALSIVGYLYARHLADPSMVDLVVYRAEGKAVWDGDDLYGPLDTPHNLLATYPPFTAMLFVPLAFVPPGLLLPIGVALNIGLVFVVVALSRRLVDPRGTRIPAYVVPAATGLALWFEPVYTTMRYGQINLALIALILWDVTRPPGSRLRGVGIGIAAGIKVIPAIFVVYLLLTGRRRAAATATAAYGATVALSMIVMPDACRRFWTHLVFRPDRVGRMENAANQSVRGLLTRVTGELDLGALGLIAMGVTGLLGMLCAIVAYRRGGDARGMPACAVAGMLASPISWSHHWVWSVPIALLGWVWMRAGRQWWRAWPMAALPLFMGQVVWTVPHHPGEEWHMSVFQLVVSSCYVTYGVIFLVTAIAMDPGTRDATAVPGPAPRKPIPAAR